MPKSEIEIDGRPFEITRNLELALRYLRLQRTELRLWADSISINQDDTEERNRHVRYMRSIYSAANETTIFLGEATEGSDALLHAMDRSKVDIALATTKNAVVKSLMNASGLSKTELMEKAFEILWRRYWRRIWIFQEIVVSDNPWVQCGRVKVRWELFCQALIALFHSDVKQWGAGYDNEPKWRLEDTYWERRAYRYSQGLTESLPKWDMASGYEFKDRTRLLDLLVTKRGSEASDSRDMVFALAGIASKPADWDPVSITYEKSVLLVYMKYVMQLSCVGIQLTGKCSVAKYLIEHDGSYEVLSHAGQHQHQRLKKIQPHHQYGHPSWAPDWRIPSDYKDKIVDWIPPPPSEDRIAKSHIFLEEYGILVCVGQVFDHIHSISDGEEVKMHPSSIGRVSWNKWHRRKLIEHGVLSHLGTKLGTVTSLFARMHPLTYRRKLAQTKGGTLCLVPRDAQAGDLICQFTGSPIPFILRPWGEEHWKRKDIGPCSKLIVKFLEWITKSTTRIFALDYVNEKISAALKNKVRKEDVEIQHYTLIGECFVDGLMNEEKSAIGDEQQNVAFALH